MNNLKTFEARLTTFSLVLLFLAYVYMYMKLDYGDVIFKVFLVNFVMSLILWGYVSVRGKLRGFSVYLIFCCIYVAAIGKVLQENILFQASAIIAIIFIAIQAFYKIFGLNKTSDTEKSKICPYCGAEVVSDSRFCGACGKRIE